MPVVELYPGREMTEEERQSTVKGLESEAMGLANPVAAVTAPLLRQLAQQAPGALSTEMGRHYLVPGAATEAPLLARLLNKIIGGYAPQKLGKDIPLVTRGDLENQAYAQIMERLAKGEVGGGSLQGTPFSVRSLFPQLRKELGQTLRETGEVESPAYAQRLREAIGKLSGDWAEKTEGGTIPLQTLRDQLSTRYREFANLQPGTLKKALSAGAPTKVPIGTPGLQIELLAQELGHEAPTGKALETIRDLVSKLPGDQRTILELSIGKDQNAPLTVMQIAEKLGRAHQSVSRSLNRARNSLREAWPKDVPFTEAAEPSDLERTVQWIKSRKPVLGTGD